MSAAKTVGGGWRRAVRGKQSLIKGPVARKGKEKEKEEAGKAKSRRHPMASKEGREAGKPQRGSTEAT